LELTANVAAATCCDVIAHGSVRATPAEIPGLRQKPGPAPGYPLPTGFLRHADDQTVTGVAAVLQAISSHGLGSHRFTEWGVLAAPRFLGRVVLAGAVQRFLAEGAWGVSPHIIPHRMLHSMSGTVSQALKIHGPNLGVGGGPGGLLEALRVAAAMLHGDRLPGLWVVLTGWDPEPIPDALAAAPAGAGCVGLALALTAARPHWRGRRLRLVPAEQDRPPRRKPPRGTDLDLLSLESLLAALTVPDVRTAAVVWQLEDGGRLELDQPEAAKSLAGPHGWLAGSGRVSVGSSGAGAENSP
jgi:hypothetical protein